MIRSLSSTVRSRLSFRRGPDPRSGGWCPLAPRLIRLGRRCGRARVFGGTGTETPSFPGNARRFLEMPPCTTKPARSPSPKHTTTYPRPAVFHPFHFCPPRLPRGAPPGAPARATSPERLTRPGLISWKTLRRRRTAPPPNPWVGASPFRPGDNALAVRCPLGAQGAGLAAPAGAGQVARAMVGACSNSSVPPDRSTIPDFFPRSSSTPEIGQPLPEHG